MSFEITKLWTNRYTLLVYTFVKEYSKEYFLIKSTILLLLSVRDCWLNEDTCIIFISNIKRKYHTRNDTTMYCVFLKTETTELIERHQKSAEKRH